MTGYSGEAVQSAVYTALTSNSTLTSAVTGVYDYVAENTLFPYVVIGEFLSQTQDDKNIDGMSSYVTIHTFDQSHGKKKTHQLISYIHDTLHNQTISISGQSFIECRWDGLSTVMQENTDNNVLYHGVIRFRIYTRES